MADSEIRIAIITISDTRDVASDLSGDILSGSASEYGKVLYREIVRDERNEIAAKLSELSANGSVELILTTGGTGVAPRDVTPEATRDVIEREITGIAEAMRRETYHKTPMSMLSRGVCGVANRTLIVNLPGSPKGVKECFAVIAPILSHAIALIKGGSVH